MSHGQTCYLLWWVSECRGFLLQCSLYFEMQPQQFVNERAKIAFIISLLSGRALQWKRSIWDSQNPNKHSLDAFATHFKEVFCTTASVISIHDELFWLRQADMSMHDHTVTFRTLAATIGWNKTALLSAFYRGLSPSLREQIVIYEDKVGLKNFLQESPASLSTLYHLPYWGIFTTSHHLPSTRNHVKGSLQPIQYGMALSRELTTLFVLWIGQPSLIILPSMTFMPNGEYHPY